MAESQIDSILVTDVRLQYLDCSRSPSAFDFVNIRHSSLARNGEIHRANHRDHSIKLELWHKLGSVEQDQMNLEDFYKYLEHSGTLRRLNHLVEMKIEF